eukprot:m.56974 g.56974  ORF g.56974 m.56974 type:complete len:91 (+) comp11070_c0_seq2:1745-2017(+)
MADSNALVRIQDKVKRLEAEIKAAHERSLLATSRATEQAAQIARLEQECASHARILKDKDERIAEEIEKRKKAEQELASVRSELSELGLG